MFPAPLKIVQNRGLTLILYETRGSYRQIFTDGRPLPVDPNPSWMGYSIGRWERDVFVVETAGFNDKVPMDILGHHHSEDLRITERFRRIDFGHMDMEVTFTDPKMFTKPITIKVAHTLLADADIFESFCENERDRVHLENAKKPQR